MEKEIKHGEYAIYNNKQFNFFETQNNLYQLIDRNYNFEHLKNLGFRKYSEKISFLDIEKASIMSAFYVTSYARYKGFKFFIENFFKGKYILRPLLEAQIHFKDYERHGYDPVYEAEENELEEIWEERKPIEGFVFDVEPIFYLKKKGE